MHVDTDSLKLKADEKNLVGHGQIWVWPVWSEVSKIDSISKVSRWIKLIFCMLVQVDCMLVHADTNDFGVALVKNGYDLLVREALKSAVSLKNEFLN